MLLNEHPCPELKDGDICVLLCYATNFSLCKVLSKDILNKVAIELVFTPAVILKDLSKLACMKVLICSIQGCNLQH